MIRIFLRGGLGNQMFQYALGLHLAKKNHNAQVLADTVFLQDRFPRKGFTYRSFALDVFASLFRFTALSRVAERLPVPGLWLGIDILGMGIRHMLGLQSVIREHGRVFDEGVLALQGNIALVGFWQSEKYFADVKDDVRAAFRFRTAPSEAVRSMQVRIRDAGNAVALHVRRGDYVTATATRALMGETDEAYYRRAIAHIIERVPAPTFFIFSDDPEWCRAHLPTATPAVYIPAELGGAGGADHLRLMAECAHNIIANSSFSWWGAWLNANPGKIVIAPRRWYVAGGDGDIVPEAWVRL